MYCTIDVETPIQFMFVDESSNPATPADIVTITASVGESVNLACHPSIMSDVMWVYHSELSKTRPRDIYADGVLVDNFADRITVELSDDRVPHLLIKEVKRSDAGLYVCIERNGAGQSHFIGLNITGKFKLDTIIDVRNYKQAMHIESVY